MSDMMNDPHFPADIEAAFHRTDPEELPSPLLIMGGGRWARVIGTVIGKMTQSTPELLFVSPHNHEGLAEWAAGLSLPIHVFQNIESALLRQPKAALVANGTAKHFDTARLLLTHGLPTFVEKPHCESAAEARELAGLAHDLGLPLAGGHVFFFARHIHNFCLSWQKASPLHHFEIEWTDAGQETRHGESKRFEITMPIIKDVIPHVWTLMRMMIPQGTLELETFQFHRGGAEVLLVVKMNGISGEIRCARNSDERRRIMRATTDIGCSTLDFSVEPGFIVKPDGEEIPADPDRVESAGPLRRELAHFFRLALGEKIEHPFTAHRIVEAIEFSDTVFEAYISARDDFLRKQAADSDKTSLMDEDIFYALREKHAEELLAAGRISSLYNQQEMEVALRDMWSAMVATGKN